MEPYVERELKELSAIPILDGLEWELSLLMDRSNSVGVIKESVPSVMGYMATKDDPSEG